MKQQKGTMKKKLNIKIFFLLNIMTMHFSASAIQDSTAQGGTVLVACICAASSYEIIQKFPGKIHPALLAGLGTVATVATYYMLQQATPAGRIKRANKLLN